MNTGRLDRKIVIQNYTDAKNAYGESERTWAAYHTTFSSISQDGGKDNNEADKTTATRKVKFKIRFFAGITENMRIVYNGYNYDITQIQELERDGLWLWANKKL
jgi:SPP1 family predicted phage head-tail adaptor